MKVYLTRRYRFSASHRLHNPAFSDDRNWQTYGKCANPHGHGHNYTLEITVSGPVSPVTGMVCDLAELDRTVQHDVLERVDHENLNCRQEFAGMVPTSEHLAVMIFNLLRQAFTAAHLEKVRLEETTMNSFEYAGGAEIRP